jgi:hypothetical protein
VGQALTGETGFALLEELGPKKAAFGFALGSCG